MAHCLLEDKLTYVGTVRKNKTEIPREFLPHKDRPVDSSLFGFTKKLSLVSFVPKKNKAVVLLSSMHHAKEVNDSTKKPTIIEFYNATKSGVDSLHQKTGNYTTGRKTRRWPMVLLYRLLDIAGVNSMVLFNVSRTQA